MAGPFPDLVRWFSEVKLSGDFRVLAMLSCSSNGYQNVHWWNQGKIAGSDLGLQSPSNSNSNWHMVVSQNRGTPSHHPYFERIFHCKPSIYWDTPPIFRETSITGLSWPIQISLDRHHTLKRRNTLKTSLSSLFLAAGKHTKNYWTWPFIADFIFFKWWFSIVMLVHQRVWWNYHNFSMKWPHEEVSGFHSLQGHSFGTSVFFLMFVSNIFFEWNMFECHGPTHQFSTFFIVWILFW